MMEHFRICIALTLMLPILAVTPPEEDVCRTYKSLDNELMNCRYIKRSKAAFNNAPNNAPKEASKLTGLSRLERYLHGRCISMPFIFQCTYNVINTCPDSVQALVNQFMQETYDDFCSNESWMHKYVAPIEIPRYQLSNCVKNVDIERCFFSRLGKENITDSTTVADGMAIRGRNIDRRLKCLARVLQEQVSTGPECNTPWQDIYVTLMGRLLSGPRRLGTKLYPEQIAQLEILTRGTDGDAGGDADGILNWLQ